MKVLRANTEQYKLLNGYRNGVNLIEFLEDGNGDMIIGLSVIDNPAFPEIREELLNLEEIEYVPPINDMP